MWEFICATFNAGWLAVVTALANKDQLERQTVVTEIAKRHIVWQDKINNGPLNNREFHEKIINDLKFRECLLNECNDLLSSIPGMEGIQLHNPLNYNTANIMEMIYNARTGDISVLWSRGYIELYKFTDGFPTPPSTNACRSFMNWYQEELRKNGYENARIFDIVRSNHVIGWRFSEGQTSYEQIKRELFIV